MSYLMTQSLISSWMYAMKENPYADATTDDTAYSDFLKTLRKEPTETNEALQNGIYLENLVEKIVKGEDCTGADWFDAAAEIAHYLRGAQMQVKVSKSVVVKGVEIVLYGRLDALKAGVIYDIKYTGNYEAGKYLGSPQHPMYFALVPEATEFVYLASNGSNVWPERYSREEAADIETIVSQFIDWLAMTGLYDEYIAHWKSL